MSIATAPKEGHDTHDHAHDKAPKPENRVKEAIDKTAKDTHDKALNVAPGAKGGDGAALEPHNKEQVHHGAPNEEIDWQLLKYRQSSMHMPTARDAATMGLAVSGIINPVATAAVVVPTAAAMGIWGKLRQLPVLSQIDRLGRSVAGGALNFADRATRWPRYAAEKVTTGVINTGIAVARVPTILLYKTKDLFTHTPGEAKHLAEQLIDGVKHLITSVWNGVKTYGHSFAQHPWKTGTFTIIAFDLLRAAFFANYTSFSGQFATTFLDILKGIAKWLGGGVTP